MLKNKKKIWFQATVRGETMLEVTIALMVVIIGSATAANLVVTSLRANMFNKDVLVATNLAQEGIEMMKNTRDSNLMKFSADPVHCWYVMPGEAGCDVSSKMISNGSYAMGQDLKLITGKLDLKADQKDTNNQFRVAYYDLDKNHDSNGDNEKVNDRDFLGTNAGSSTKVDDSKFYREIGVTLGSTTPPTDMQVISKVQWLDGGVLHEVKMDSHLTNGQ